MGAEFTPREARALYGILCDNPSDIILKTDRDGFIVYASPALAGLGYRLPSLLFGPRLLDLVEPSHGAMVQAQLDQALRGRRASDWIEFPATLANGGVRWFGIRSRALIDHAGNIYGALSVLRDIDRARLLEEELFAAALTDPLTGLTNRTAFVAMLRHMVEQRIGGSLALFEIDHFRAINLRHGRAVGDKVLLVFADLLRNLMRRDDIISRIGGRRLAVLFPGTMQDEAECASQRIVETLSEVRDQVGRDRLAITASAGIARIGTGLDETIDRAEIALFLARAKGRNRLENDRGAHLPPPCQAALTASLARDTTRRSA